MSFCLVNVKIFVKNCLLYANKVIVYRWLSVVCNLSVYNFIHISFSTQSNQNLGVCILILVLHTCIDMNDNLETFINLKEEVGDKSRGYTFLIFDWYVRLLQSRVRFQLVLIGWLHN